MKYIKTYENNNEVLVGVVRYSDDKKELEPLTKMGVKYVLRQGDNKEAYYKLDYDDIDYNGEKWVDKYGYAPIGEEIPDDFFHDKKIKYIESIYITMEKYNI